MRFIFKVWSGVMEVGKGPFLIRRRRLKSKHYPEGDFLHEMANLIYEQHKLMNSLDTELVTFEAANRGMTTGRPEERDFYEKMGRFSGQKFMDFADRFYDSAFELAQLFKQAFPDRADAMWLDCLVLPRVRHFDKLDS